MIADTHRKLKRDLSNVALKLRIAITCLSACLLPAPALRAQDSPRVACYDLTVRIDAVSYTHLSSGQVVTHFERRRELGLPDTQPLVDDMAPLSYVRPDCRPMLCLMKVCRISNNARRHITTNRKSATGE